MRKFLASLLAASLVASMGVAAFANDDGAESGGMPPAVESTAAETAGTAEPTTPEDAETPVTTETPEAPETEETAPAEKAAEKPDPAGNPETDAGTEQKKPDNEDAAATEKREDQAVSDADNGIAPIAAAPEMVQASISVRPDGNNGNTEDFQYGEKYEAAGVSLSGTTVTVNLDKFSSADGQTAAAACKGGSVENTAFFGFKIDSGKVPNTAQYFTLENSGDINDEDQNKGVPQKISEGSYHTKSIISYVPFAKKSAAKTESWEALTGSYQVTVHWFAGTTEEEKGKTAVEGTDEVATTTFTVKVVTDSDAKADVTPKLATGEGMNPEGLRLSGTNLSGEVKAGIGEAKEDIQNLFKKVDGKGTDAVVNGLTFMTLDIPVPATANTAKPITIRQHNEALHVAYPDDKSDFPGYTKTKTYPADSGLLTTDKKTAQLTVLVKPGADVELAITWAKSGDEGGTLLSQFTVNTSGVKLSVPSETYTAGKLEWDKDTGKVPAEDGSDSRGTLTYNKDTDTYSTAEDTSIAYYPKDLKLGHDAGNMVGLTIAPPQISAGSDAKKAIVPDKSKTTYTMTGGKNTFTDPKTPYWSTDGDKTSFHAYPMPTANSKVITIKVNWVEAGSGASYPVEYKLDLSKSTLAQAETVGLTFKAVLVGAGDDGANKTEVLTNYGGPKTIEKGAALNTIQLPDPAYTGYIFSGWYGAENLKTALSFTDEITEAKDIFAKFVAEPKKTEVASDINTAANVANKIENNEAPTKEELTAAKEAVESVLEKAPTAAALEKVAGDDEILAMDQAYQAAAEVTVTEKTVNEDKSVASNKVSEVKIMGGAALSAKSDSKDAVALTVETPEAADEIPEAQIKEAVSSTASNVEFKNIVQVDIELKQGSDVITELKAPLFLDLKIPTGMDVSKMRIFKDHNGFLKELAYTVVNKSYARVKVTELSTFAIVELAAGGGTPGTTPGGTPGGTPSTPSYSHGGSGGGGGGSSSSNKSAGIFSKMTSTINGILKMRLTGGKGVAAAGTAAPASPLTASAAKGVMNTAIAKAVDGKASAVLRNVTSIAPEVLSSMASQAAKANVTATLAADTMDGAAVGARVYVDAAAAAKLGRAIDVSAVTGNAAAEKALAASYKNKLVVLDMGQDGPFGMNVNVAARLNFAGMDKTKLAFYSYNEKTKQLAQIEAPAFWFDANGYIHFSTAMGNCIVISDGPLVQK